jgi:uncharacterized protein (DUF2237 family)
MTDGVIYEARHLCGHVISRYMLTTDERGHTQETRVPERFEPMKDDAHWCRVCERWINPEDKPEAVERGRATSALVPTPGDEA